MARAYARTGLSPTSNNHDVFGNMWSREVEGSIRERAFPKVFGVDFV